MVMAGKLMDGRLGHLPAHSIEQMQGLFDLTPNHPQLMLFMNIAGWYLHCANLLTNNLRILLFPICCCLLFSMQNLFPLDSQRTRGKMFICDVGKGWHGRQSRTSDTWSTCEAFTTSVSIALPVAAGKAWRLFMGSSRQIPRIMLYRWCMPLDWFVLITLRTKHLWKAAVQPDSIVQQQVIMRKSLCMCVTTIKKSQLQASWGKRMHTRAVVISDTVTVKI